MKPSAQAHAKKPHLFGWLSDIKLKTKLLLILFLTVLIVFLCTFLTARIPYASYDSQLYLRSVQMISLFSDQLQSEMARVSDATFSILGDNVLQKT